MRFEKHCPRIGDEAFKVAITCYEKKQDRIGQVKRQIPFEISETSGGNFSCRVEGDDGRSNAKANEPWNCPPVGRIKFAVGKN